MIQQVLDPQLGPTPLSGLSLPGGTPAARQQHSGRDTGGSSICDSTKGEDSEGRMCLC